MLERTRNKAHNKGFAKYHKRRRLKIASNISNLMEQTNKRKTQKSKAKINILESNLNKISLSSLK